MSTHVLPDRCWQLSHHPEVRGMAGAGWPHFADRRSALTELWEEYSEARADLEEGEKLRDNHPELLGAHPERLDEPCVVLICDGCGLGMHWEGDPVPAGTHFESAAFALEWAALDSAWSTTSADGDDAYGEHFGRVFHHCTSCNAMASPGASVAAS